MFWYEYSVTLLRPPSSLLVIKQATAQDQWFYFWYVDLLDQPLYLVWLLSNNNQKYSAMLRTQMRNSSFLGSQMYYMV